MKRYLISALAILSFAVIPQIGAAQTPDALFQQALRMERVQGDYQGAIGVYEQIVGSASADRRTIARALVQMGKAYESLGRTEAFSIYERVVRDFNDFEEQVTEARNRMQGLAAPSIDSEPVRSPGEISIIPFHGDRDNGRYDGVDMSPDGRYLVFVSRRESFIQEIETGENVNISLSPNNCASTGMKFSPDGENIAYGCWGGGVGIYNRRTEQSTQILDAQEYYGLSEDDFVEMEVFDWTENQDSLMVSIWGSPSEVSENGHQLLLAPVNGDDPRIINSSNDLGDHFMRDTNACLMRNDRFLFGEWWFDNKKFDRYEFYIQRVSTVGANPEKVLYDISANFELFGCDKSNNILYYSVQYPGMNTTLWGAFVKEDGSLSRKQTLANLASNTRAHPIRQDGNLYYTESVLGRGDEWHGRLTDSGAQYLGQGKSWTLDWTDDGRFRADKTGFREITITNTETSVIRSIDTGHQNWTLAWFPDGERFLTSYWPNTENTGNQYTRSWIHDANSGAVIDSINGVRAFATSEDGESVIFPDVGDDGVCVTSMRLVDRSRTHLFCFPDALGVPRAFNAWEMSRSRKLIWLHYSGADSTNTYRIVSLDGSVDYTLREGELNRNIEFLPDDSGAIIIEKTALFFFDLKTGIETEISSGLPPNMFHQFYGWKLHPDGIRFDARLGSSKKPASELKVIHNVADLFNTEN